MGKMSATVLKKTIRDIALDRSTENISLPRVDYSSIPHVKDIPFLIGIQLNSFNWFCDEGLRDLFERVFPLEFHRNMPHHFFELFEM